MRAKLGTKRRNTLYNQNNEQSLVSFVGGLNLPLDPSFESLSLVGVVVQRNPDSQSCR